MSMQMNRNTVVFPPRGATDNDAAVANAVSILRRDIARRFLPGDAPAGNIVLAVAPMAEPEAWAMEIAGGTLTLRAGDALGFVYGLLYISETFLKIRPFWFWMDQRIEPWPGVELPEGVYTSRPFPVRYRGWFLNDEVLLDAWRPNGDPELGWRMALEALLRCGGNLVIPGTDQNSHIHRPLAAGMGLWITHHHAEPLGAEMFLRAYPDQDPDYSVHPELFHALWGRAAEEQKDQKVVWCLGFRGQADMPFWAHDTQGRFDTDEKRGALISRVIALQQEIVRKHVAHPVFCTNLYGEVMELYGKGCLTLDPDIILIYADNGYGAMVSRRQGNHDPRIPALPAEPAAHGGIYYHASFYDLQAAGHITHLPNRVDYVNGQLDQVLEKNLREFWIVNCSNVRPHVYLLDAIRKKWAGRDISDGQHSAEFAADYYGGAPQAARAWRDYPAAMLPFGPEQDQHAGEQFYTEIPRLIAHARIRGDDTAHGLFWLAGERPLVEQTAYFSGLCRDNLPRIQAYVSGLERDAAALSGETRQLFDATVLLHGRLQLLGTRGGIDLGRGFRALEAKDYLSAFLAFGDGARCFLDADRLLRAGEYGVWDGFYANDCLADYKHTAYLFQKLMGLARELGDDPSHHRWYRLAVFPPGEREIRTILVHHNHMTDWALYQAFQKCEWDIGAKRY